MKALCLQHVQFETPAVILDWLTEKKIDYSILKVYEDDVIFPAQESFDLLFIMGGPMSVNDEDEYPWLKGEKDFIRDSIKNNKKIMGICLGAQLIASATGKRVYKNNHSEIGWFDIEFKNGNDIFPHSEKPLKVFHWHGETFELPEGSEPMACSAGCENQAFILGNNIIGFQCHLEFNSQSVENIINHCSEEIVSGKYIQNPETMVNESKKYIEKMNTYLFQLLDRFYKGN